MSREGVVDVSQPLIESMDYQWPSGYKHVAIGNTWKVTGDGRWLLPEKTLGWECIEFASRYYLNKNGEPFVFTDEQLRVILWLYAVDSDGAFLMREYYLQRLKGWGKLRTPLLLLLRCLKLSAVAGFLTGMLTGIRLLSLTRLRVW